MMEMASTSNTPNTTTNQRDVTKCCFDCSRCPKYEPHPWRNLCKNCRCPTDGHDVSTLAAESRRSFNIPKYQPDSRFNNLYEFVPLNITTIQQANHFYAQLPINDVPKIGSVGVLKRFLRLARQLPLQDSSLAKSKFVHPTCVVLFENYIYTRNLKALTVGMASSTYCGVRKCEKCHRVIPDGQIGIRTPKSKAAVWHPSCFRCSACDDLLADFVCFFFKDKIYCGRHYGECFKTRCQGCDELIFSNEHTEAMDKNWHTSHFCCWQCDKMLKDERFLGSNGQPYCVDCYQKNFCKTCQKCSGLIGVDTASFSNKTKHWHESCLTCLKCSCSLVDKSVREKDDCIYCVQCYDEQFARKCEACDQKLLPGKIAMTYQTRQWHENCFRCEACKTLIGAQSFVAKDKEIFCSNCYKIKFGVKCIKCHKPILTGGITYRKQPWHKDCFCCTRCSKNLIGESFLSREDKPYCSSCFDEIFTNKCSGCRKPIRGDKEKEMTFMSFEDRHWHSDCFVCTSCCISLDNVGFISDGNDIFCSDCDFNKRTDGIIIID